jgi:lauroyl/myristoyl acyltransferase
MKFLNIVNYLSHFELYDDFEALEPNNLIDSLYSLMNAYMQSGPGHLDIQTHFDELLPQFEKCSISQKASELALSHAKWSFLSDVDNIVMYSYLKSKKREQLLKIEGLNYARELIEKHGNCLFIPLHIGPFQSLPFLLSDLGFKISQPLVNDNQKFLDGLNNFKSHMNYENLRFLPFQDGFFEKCISDINQGQILCLYPEWTASGKIGSLSSELLGNKVHCPTGVARMALKQKLPIMSVEYVKDSKHSYSLKFGKVWHVSTDVQVKDVTLDIFSWINSFVSKHPEQWKGWSFYEDMKFNALASML